MAYSHSYQTPYRNRDIAEHGTTIPGRESYFIAAWWMFVASVGVLISVFGRDFLPPKFSIDVATIRALLAFRDLWNGMSFDSFVNTARVWSVVLDVLPEAFAIPAYYCLLVAVAIRLLDVFDVPLARYHLIAGSWIMCSAIFLSQPSKEMIALPVTLFFCLARSWGARLLATLLFFLYAAFFRPYWAICYFYFLFVLVAFRLHVASRSRLAVFILLLAFALPFVAADVLGFEPLTDARTMMNADRVDSPDARSAFNNLLENTGFATDLANTIVAWLYMNVPVALLLDGSPHYVFFVVFQIFSLWFFVAGCTSLVRDAKRTQHPDSVHLRCAAFVIAFSLTQAIFEPDFGSFLRHEMDVMIPMLILVLYRARATRLHLPA